MTQWMWTQWHHLLMHFLALGPNKHRCSPLLSPLLPSLHPQVSQTVHHHQLTSHWTPHHTTPCQTSCQGLHWVPPPHYSIWPHLNTTSRYWHLLLHHRHHQLVAALIPLNAKELAPNILSSSPTSMMHLVTWQMSWKIKTWSSRSLSLHSLTPGSFRWFRTIHRVISVWKRREKSSITSSTIPLLPHMRPSMMNFTSHGFILLLMVRCNFNSFMTLCCVTFWLYV